jgi:hypothetical protein
VHVFRRRRMLKFGAVHRLSRRPALPSSSVGPRIFVSIVLPHFLFYVLPPGGEWVG